jgi:hypothetical protein
MMSKYPPLVAPFALVFSIGPANATGVVFKDCHSAPPAIAKTIQHLIGPDWTIYRPFMKSCPVTSPTGQTPLLITALSLPAANAAGKLFVSNGKVWNSQTAQQTYDRIPLPIISDRRGRVLGRRPADLLPTPPQRTIVTFDHWKHGWPWRIIMRENDPTVSPPLSPCGAKALIWDSKRYKFIDVASFCINSSKVALAVNEDKKHGT